MSSFEKWIFQFICLKSVTIINIYLTDYYQIYHCIQILNALYTLDQNVYHIDKFNTSRPCVVHYRSFEDQDLGIPSYLLSYTDEQEDEKFLVSEYEITSFRSGKNLFMFHFTKVWSNLIFIKAISPRTDIGSYGFWRDQLPLRCIVCSSQFWMPYELDEHYASQHSNLCERVRCEKCITYNRVFRTSIENSKPVESFYTRSLMICHMSRRHTLIDEEWSPYSTWSPLYRELSEHFKLYYGSRIPRPIQYLRN